MCYNSPPCSPIENLSGFVNKTPAATKGLFSAVGIAEAPPTVYLAFLGTLYAKEDRTIILHLTPRTAGVIDDGLILT